jgi:RHS repeat-associated protein
MIPAFPDEQTRIDYDLTYYVNDVNLTNTQVLAEYGRRGELKNVYTYGVQRLNAARVDGTVDTYEYDGRGSVVSDGVHTYEYDPFGGILSEISGELPFFGYNAEEYNPVTGLVYLRARYYNVETGTFISEDSYLGSDDNISSQNRYAFGEGDPINNIDPTGHFASLITQQAGWQTDYWGNKFDKYANSQITNQTNAINERSYNDYSISEKKANEYAKNGGDAARGLCTSYSCVPGSQVEKAISAMEDHIDDVEKTSNEKIKEIRDNNMALWAPSAPKPSTPSDGGSSGGSSSSSTGGNAGGGGNGGSSNSENSVPERTQYENDLISELSGKIKLTHTFNNITIKLNLGITVYLGLHKVIPPFPFYHATLFIFVTPSARVYYNDYSRGKLSFKDLYDTNGVKIQGVKYATIGGTSSQEGPDNGNPLTGLLIGGYNRPSDMKLESKISVEKLNITDLERLFNLVDTFNNKSNLGYSLFAIGKQYNSSSFMRGLLNVYGIDLGDKTGNRYVGWNKPAPSNYYF